MALPPAPPEDLPEAEEPPEPEIPEEPEEKKDLSLDSVFGALEAMVGKAEEEPAPPPAPKPEKQTFDPPEKLRVDCHDCGKAYMALIEELPVMVECPFCGVGGRIDEI